MNKKEKIEKNLNIKISNISFIMFVPNKGLGFDSKQDVFNDVQYLLEEGEAVALTYDLFCNMSMKEMFAQVKSNYLKDLSINESTSLEILENPLNIMIVPFYQPDMERKDSYPIKISFTIPFEAEAVISEALLTEIDLLDKTFRGGVQT